MNRQFGCTIVERDGLFFITNRYGDEYVYRIEPAGDGFLIENRIDERRSNHLYSREDFTWNTRAVRYSREDAEAWLRYEYSEGEAPPPSPAEQREYARWLANR